MKIVFCFECTNLEKHGHLILNKEQFTPDIAKFRVRKTPKRRKNVLFFMF